MAAPVQSTPTIPTKKGFDAASAVMAAACGLSLATTLLALAILPLGHGFAGQRDFAIYWATGRQLLHHTNPYDAQALLALEQSAGYTGSGGFTMRNPPWSVWLALPAGMASARAAALPWSLLMLAVVMAALHSLWKTFGRPHAPLDWLACCFPPALIAVAMGQLSVLPLLGLAWFLRFYRTRPFRAGAALWLCALKPHLLVPFAAALALWMVLERKWRVLAGAAAAMAASAAVTAAVAPHAWAQYAQWAHSWPAAQEPMPCLSVALREWVAPTARWLDFVPCAIACVWAAGYFLNRRAQWDWVRDGGLLVLVGLAVAPYGRINDQCLAIAPLVYAAARTRSRMATGALGAACLAVAVEVLVSCPVNSAWYLWPAAAWLAWWVWAQRTSEAGAAAA